MTQPKRVGSAGEPAPPQIARKPLDSLGRSRTLREVFRSWKPGPRVWLALLFVFALSFGWLALATPDQAEDVATPVEAPHPLQPSAAAEPAPASLTAQHRAKLAPAAQATAAATASAPLPEPAKQPGPTAPIPPDTRGFVDAIQGRFDDDTRDREAGAVEAGLQAFIRTTKLPASALKSVVCRQSVCKLEMYWRSEYDAPYRSTLDDLAGGNAKLVATRAEAPDRNAGVSVDVYWLRALGTLPEARNP